MIKGLVAMAMAVAGLVVTAFDARAQVRLSDAQIFALFDEANTADIWAARVAIARSQSTEVGKLAAMVVADHEAVQHVARELAKRLNVTAVPPRDDGTAAALAASIAGLQSKADGEFDRAYLIHELAFHKSAIDAVRGTLLPSAGNGELKALLEKVLGGFEHHLAETRRVADALGVR